MAQKVFEDKEFHGGVKFFGTVKSVVENPEGEAYEAKWFTAINNESFSLAQDISGNIIKGLNLADVSVIAWSSNSLWWFLKDTGLARVSAGVLEVNSGTAGTLRDLVSRAFAVEATEKINLDGSLSGDTYITEASANVINIVAGGSVGAKIYGKGLQTLEATAYTADNGGEASSVIPAGANNVDVEGVASDANDWMLLPTALLGMRLIIYCNAGSNFELRTPAGSDETINDVNADGDTLEYLCTDTESIALTCVSDGKWIAVGYSKLGAIVTAVVPD